MTDVNERMMAIREDQIARLRYRVGELSAQRSALLQAAEAMVRGVDRYRDPAVHTALSGYVAELEAAIAKARGEQS